MSLLTTDLLMSGYIGSSHLSKRVASGETLPQSR